MALQYCLEHDTTIDLDVEVEHFDNHVEITGLVLYSNCCKVKLTGWDLEIALAYHGTTQCPKCRQYCSAEWN